MKRVKCSADCCSSLFSLPKQLNLVPGSSRLTVPQPATLLHFWHHRFIMAKFVQIWSTVAAYDELCVWFYSSQSETKKYFEEWITRAFNEHTVWPVYSRPLPSPDFFLRGRGRLCTGCTLYFQATFLTTYSDYSLGVPGVFRCTNHNWIPKFLSCYRGVVAVFSKASFGQYAALGAYGLLAVPSLQQIMMYCF